MPVDPTHSHTHAGTVTHARANTHTSSYRHAATDTQSHAHLCVTTGPNGRLLASSIEQQATLLCCPPMRYPTCIGLRREEPDDCIWTATQPPAHRRRWAAAAGPSLVASPPPCVHRTGVTVSRSVTGAGVATCSTINARMQRRIRRSRRRIHSHAFPFNDSPRHSYLPPTYSCNFRIIEWQILSTSSPVLHFSSSAADLAATDRGCVRFERRSHARKHRGTSAAGASPCSALPHAAPRTRRPSARRCTSVPAAAAQQRVQHSANVRRPAAGPH